MMAALRSLFRPGSGQAAPEGRALGSEVAWSESQLLMGPFPKYNPDDLIGRQGAGVYRKMMLDEQVKAVVKFKRDAITARDYYFEVDVTAGLSDSEAERRVRLYDAMVSRFKGSFCDGMNFIMKGMFQGFSITEKVIEPFEFEGRPYLGISRLSPKPFETFLFRVDDYGRVLACVQQMNGREQEVDLSKFVYFVHNPEFDQHYGQSDLREAYRSWYSKDVVIRFHNLFLERLAGGLVVAQPTGDRTVAVNSPEYFALKAVIDNIRSMSGVLMPSGVDLKVESPQTTDAFERAIAMHDLQIAKALLVPNLLGISHQGDTGSYSQADVQLEAFMWTLDADARRLEDALNEQLFGQLAELNFADGLGPRFRFKPVSERKKHEIITKWKELVGAGAVEASDTDEAHLRELLDFPDKGEPLPPRIGPSPLTPGAGPSPRRPADDGYVAETPRAERTGSVVSDAAFSRATRRVKFAVIDRRSREAEARDGGELADRLADAVAEVVVRIREERLGTPAGDADAIPGLDFPPAAKTRARKAVDALLRGAWDLGLRHARDEVAGARGEAARLDMGRIDEQAAEYLRANGFRMLGNLLEPMRSIVLQVLVNGLKFSWTTDEIVRRVYDSLTRAGYLALAANASATGRAEDDVLEALGEALGGGTHRVRAAVRTAVFDAINEARYSTFTDPGLGGFVEALEYSAILDDRTTDICRHLDGRVYPADSPEWDVYRPPNHYQCRSILVPVTVIDTEVRGRGAGDDRYSPPPSLQPQQGFGGQTG